jgi:hypothetical protein
VASDVDRLGIIPIRNAVRCAAVPPLRFYLRVASRRLTRGHKGPSGDVAKHRSFLVLFSEAGIENVADADDADELVFRYHRHVARTLVRHLPHHVRHGIVGGWPSSRSQPWPH